MVRGVTRYSEADLTVMQNKVRGGVERHGRMVKNDTLASTCSAGGLNKKLRRTAGSNPAPSPQYRSKWEAAYASRLELDKRAGLIKAYWYEPFSLWLPGNVRYKPDFMVQYENSYPACGFLEIVEVKGWSKNRRDGMTRLKIAAALFPCFVWRLVYRTKGGGWDGEYV